MHIAADYQRIMALILAATCATNGCSYAAISSAHSINNAALIGTSQAPTAAIIAAIIGLHTGILSATMRTDIAHLKPIIGAAYAADHSAYKALSSLITTYIAHIIRTNIAAYQAHIRRIISGP